MAKKKEKKKIWQTQATLSTSLSPSQFTLFLLLFLSHAKSYPKLPHHAENSKTVHGFVKVIIIKLISCHLVIMVTDWLVRTKTQIDMQKIRVDKFSVLCFTKDTKTLCLVECLFKSHLTSSPEQEMNPHVWTSFLNHQLKKQSVPEWFRSFSVYFICSVTTNTVQPH